MDILKKLYGFAFKAKDVTGLVIALIVYIVVLALFGWLIGLLSGIPVVGILVGIVCGILDLYGLIGIILSILVFLKVLK